jgi:hypothetical protein
MPFAALERDAGGPEQPSKWKLHSIVLPATASLGGGLACFKQYDRM